MTTPNTPIYVETATGNTISLTAQKYGSLTVEDIVIGLSNIERFNGRANGLSVLQHSYAMYQYAKKVLGYNDTACLLTLLHDAHEALLGDSITPLKDLVPGIREAEQEVQKRILARFRLIDLSSSPIIAEIDELACHVEYVHFVAGSHKRFTGEDLYTKNAEVYNFNKDELNSAQFNVYLQYINNATDMSQKDLIDTVSLILYRHLATYGE